MSSHPRDWDSAFSQHLKLQQQRWRIAWHGLPFFCASSLLQPLVSLPAVIEHFSSSDLKLVSVLSFFLSFCSFILLNWEKGKHYHPSQQTLALEKTSRDCFWPKVQDRLLSRALTIMYFFRWKSVWRWKNYMQKRTKLLNYGWILQIKWRIILVTREQVLFQVSQSICLSSFSFFFLVLKNIFFKDCPDSGNKTACGCYIDFMWSSSVVRSAIPCLGCMWLLISNSNL